MDLERVGPVGGQGTTTGQPNYSSKSVVFGPGFGVKAYSKPLFHQIVCMGPKI
jgi:hypothetical protein